MIWLAHGKAEIPTYIHTGDSGKLWSVSNEESLLEEVGAI